MKTNRISKRLSIILIFLTVMISSCSGEIDPRPQAWIDFPRDGASVPLGEAITVTSHAFAREGLAEVVLSVNGEAYRRDAPVEAGVEFTEFKQEWIPTDIGIYTLQLQAYDTTGEISNPATISVRVTGEIVVEPIEVDPTTDPPTPVISSTPTLTPTLTPEPVEAAPAEGIEVATCPPIATALQSANCRSGPGTA